jgi:GPH family glycoside/pentoside/hexuronide:cation symporter
MEAPSNQEVSMRQKVYYGFGNLGSGLLMGIFGAATIKYYSDVVGLDAAAISVVFLVYAVWNAINDPIFGYLSDRVQWKGSNGHRIPWLRLANPFLALFFALTWFSPLDRGWVSAAYLFIMLLLYDTCYTIVGLNMGALLADMHESTIERSRIQLVGAIFGAIAAIGAILIPSFLLTSDINLPLFQGVMVVLAVISLIFLEICAYKVQIRFIEEPNNPMGLIDSIKEAVKNRSFMALVLSNFTMIFLSGVATGALFYFIEYVLQVEGFGLVVPIIFILLGIAIGAVLLMQWMKTIGGRSAMLRGMTVAGIGLISLTFLPSPFIYVSLAFVGFGLIMPLLLFNVLVGDLADEDELKTGNRREGMFFGFNALITKPAQSLAASLIVYMLTWFQYVKPVKAGDLYISQPQSEFTIWGMRLMYGLIPGLFVLFGVWIFSFYLLSGDRLMEVKRQLAEKNMR